MLVRDLASCASVEEAVERLRFTKAAARDGLVYRPFTLLLLAYATGLIQPHGINPG